MESEDWEYLSWPKKLQIYYAARDRVDDPTPRAALLTEAAELVGVDRNKSYGDPTENFGNTAALWNAQFAHLLKDGARFTSAHIAQAQILVKMARLIAQSKRDNYLDIAGYAACGWECE